MRRRGGIARPRALVPLVTLVILVALLHLPGCAERERQYLRRADFSSAFLRLFANKDGKEREELSRAIVRASSRSGELIQVVERFLGDRILAVGFTVDHWTEGASPAALLVTNPGKEPWQPALRLACNTGEGALSKPSNGKNMVLC